MAIVILYDKLLRNTVFEFSSKRKMYISFFLWKEIFLLIITGSLFFEYFGPNEISSFITMESIENTTQYIYLAIIELIVFISIFSKTIFRNKLLHKKPTNFKPKNSDNAKLLVTSLLISTVLSTITLHSTGLRHAFQYALINSESLLDIRLGNRYESNTPPLLFIFHRQLHFLLAISIGFYAKKISKTLLVSGLIVTIYASTLNGDKAPLIYSIIIAYIAKIQSPLNQSKLDFKNTLALILSASILIVYMVKLQYPDIDIAGFTQYAADRLAVGQIQGVYEQFSLKLNDIAYLSAEIPLSGRWLEQKSFGKDLMMSTLSYGLDPSSTGVLNSFFIGNALAAGGILLVIVSPIFVAFNYCLMTATTVYFLNNFYKLDSYDSRLIATAFITVSIPFTGDFSGLLFGKAFLFLIALLMLIYMSKNVYTLCTNMVKKQLPNINNF